MLKVGDKVKIYHEADDMMIMSYGVVREIDENGETLDVEYEDHYGNPDNHRFWAKQCEIIKEPRRIMISSNFIADNEHTYTKEYASKYLSDRDLTEFIEVIKK